MNNKIYKLYQELHQKHGKPIELWPQWCSKKKNKRTRDLIAIGAVLTQRTSWRNANIVLNNLKDNNLLSLEKISKLNSANELTELIRPAGFFQTKPKRLHEFARFVIKEYGSLENMVKEDLHSLREKLLNLYGIGPETADVILLYSLGKPSFVIDEYTKRLVAKKNISSQLTYDHLKQLFEDNLPKDVKIYQNYHALIIVEQRGREASKMEIV